ncbi:hypothetical protein C8A00DRAFT_11927 [Chaetomidium leptoderma]|uniref:Rhodopsin domain-containing protein n=1 Tax=Chaetomidium leptoderma TaxID=669021 RepID=A0AAN6VSV3_9PEZI|nr:hypothetical protein C8A00DRAFT_11927 [Chaetomidium leptoderma]
MQSTDPPPGNPPGLISNPSETRQANIIACAVITWAIGAIFVGLRFYARGYLLRNVIGVEDWLMVVALVFSAATSAGAVEQAVYGHGKHALDIDPNVVVAMSRAGWYSIIWYMLSLLATKASILLLYLRVLSFRHSRYVVYALLAMVIVANGIFSLSLVFTACKPLHAFWDPVPDAWCRPQRDFFINTGLHIATDVLMYVLPLPVIVRLRVELRQKLALYGILALGFFVCAISMIRFFQLTLQNSWLDYPYEGVSISYLNGIELNAAIACACCMTLRPLMHKLFPHLWSARGSSDGNGRGRRPDVELGPAGGPGGGAGALDNTLAPPTIGSKPLRIARARENDLDNSQLLSRDDDEFSGGGGGRDDKQSIRTETDGGSFAEAGSGSGRAWTPREPTPISTLGRNAAHT